MATPTGENGNTFTNLKPPTNIQHKKCKSQVKLTGIAAWHETFPL